MKRILAVLLSLAVAFAFSACEAANADENSATQFPSYTASEANTESSEAAESSSSETANASGVKYEDVSSFIQNALSDMGVQGKPQNVTIESFEASGTTHATINFEAGGKQLSAGCFKDSEDKNWRLVDISSGKGNDQKFYWLSDLVKGKQDLYDFKTDKLISKKSE